MVKNNKKNAFTLVELIGVIVILGVILLIAVPNVSNIIKTSKKNSYISATKMASDAIKSEGELARFDKSFNFNEEFCIYNFKDLDFSNGKLDGSGIVVVKPVGNSYQYFLYATNGTYALPGVNSINMSDNKFVEAEDLGDEELGLIKYTEADFFDPKKNAEYKTTCKLENNTNVVADYQNLFVNSTDKPLPIKYTVTFDSNGGSIVASQNVDENKTVTKPDNPTKEDSDFLGWFKDGTEFDFANTLIAQNITLKAKWKPAKFAGSCNQYEILKIKNAIDSEGYEEFYVLKNANSDGNVVLFARYGLMNGGKRQGESAELVYRNSGSKTNFDYYKDYYKDYIASLGINVKKISDLNSTHLPFMGCTANVISSMNCKITKKSITKYTGAVIKCNDNAFQTLLTTQNYWTTITNNSSGGGFATGIYVFSDYVLANKYTGTFGVVRPVIEIPQADIPICIPSE